MNVRDQEYPSTIWLPAHTCEHPYESVQLQVGHFPPENPEGLSVFRMDCFRCGASWNESSTGVPWIYEYLGRMIADGRFGVVSFEDPEIAHKVEWRRQTRYDRIMEDLTGSTNPILDSEVVLRRPD